ncbi:MAG: IS481 family transposase [Chloroflexota bacterium]|nr:IS481 family transposase [Chloroflexota bacterium]
MDIGRYLVEAHLREGRSVADLASEHGVHRSWLYKLLVRYRREGETGFAPRSRRPRRSPSAMDSALADEIVALRTNLLDQGLDAGALTLHWHLARRHGAVPSVSSVWRVLRRRGLVVPQPRKRPRSSLVRFQAELPNECWQSDMTHWSLVDGRGCEIVNFIDDHSRLCLRSVALAVTTAVDVGTIFQQARAQYGTPAAVLTDNGCIFTAEHRGGKVVLQTELERLGIRHKHARPYHPQTCGKVERFHQTLKKYLAKQPPADSLEVLQLQIERFVTYYNEQRPHRALGRATPREVYDAKVKARPTARVETHFRIRHDKIDKGGKLTLRFESKLLHIGMGARLKGLPVVLLVADRDVRVVSAADGELLRHLTLDPTRNYQRQSA